MLHNYMFSTDDLRLNSLPSLITPLDLISKLPNSQKIETFIQNKRQEAIEIIQGVDDRLMVVVGPCSIHDVQSAFDYALRLQKLSAELENELLIIMRVYFEKPRTIIGWKGLISDPGLDGSFNFNQGLTLARQLLLELGQIKLPAATEFLDTSIPCYLGDLITWSAIGARTVESQIHRELASGLSMPVGFKNNTDGNIKVAIDAVNVAKQSHHFLGIQQDGTLNIIRTSGNPNCHIILRGSRTGPNFFRPHLDEAIKMLKHFDLKPFLMIDCNHGNSMKEYQRQALVIHYLIKEIELMSSVMLESNLVPGNQKLQPVSNRIYGQSITDGCVGWDETQALLYQLAKAVQRRRFIKTNSG